MGVRRINIDLSVAGEFELVPNSNVINGLTLSGLPAGVAVFVKLGNNEQIGPFGNIGLTFGPGTDFKDVSEGVRIVTITNFPGVILGGFVSYATKAFKPNTVSGIGAQGL